MPHRTARPKLALAAAVLVLGFVPFAAHAEWMNDTEAVPVKRLVRNLTSRVEKNPKDAHAHYVLARVHSMAWARGTETLPVNPPEKKDGVPGFAPWQTVREGRGAEAAPDRAATGHFHRSVVHYRHAVRLDGAQAVHHLGLAWMLDSGSRWVRVLGAPDGARPKTDVPTDERERYSALTRTGASGKDGAREKAREALVKALPGCAATLRSLMSSADETAEVRKAAASVLTRHWHDLALASYRRAYKLAAKRELEAEDLGGHPADTIAQEAGQAILRLVKGRADTDALLAERARLEETLAILNAKPRWETPIVFPIDGPAPLRNLLPTGRSALFDLDGDDEPGRWPWVSARTAFLVWAPDAGRPISSGRQLFGSVTWWCRWRNGYEPLAALDDDGDGVLSGSELDGLAVWIDADGDGTSDPGEVTPALRYGIARVQATPDGLHDGVPTHGSGIKLRDGTALPTYDWTPTRLDDAPSID